MNHIFLVKASLTARSNYLESDVPKSFWLGSWLRFFFSPQKKKGQEQCNKAIMVITDGPSETYKEIFETHNWPNKTVSWKNVCGLKWRTSWFFFYFHYTLGSNFLRDLVMKISFIIGFFFYWSRCNIVLIFMFVKSAMTLACALLVPGEGHYY